MTRFWSKKSDANQPEIVEALRAIGASVLPIHRLGQGAPDILVYFRGIYHVLEIKTKKGKLTKDEEEFHEYWKGPIPVVRTIDEAFAAIGAVIK